MARRLIATKSLVAAAVVAAGLLSGAGCADSITFSKSERAEGRIALAEGDHESASIIFANQVRRSPRDYKAHFHLGEARWAAGHRPEAVRSYMTALDVMPLSPRGRADDEYRFLIVNSLAFALAQTDTDGTQLAEIERLSKGDKVKKLLVAMTYAKAGEPDAAIAAFESARRLDRQDPQIVKAYGLYLESIRQEEAAEQMLRRAYSLDPQDEEVAAGLRRLGIIPGPAILSKTQLATPAMPLGPLPPVKVKVVREGESAAAPTDPQAGLN